VEGKVFAHHLRSALERARDVPERAICSLVLVVILGMHIGPAGEKLSSAINPSARNHSHRALHKVRWLVLGAEVADATLEAARDESLGADLSGVVVEIFLSYAFSTIKGTRNLPHRTRIDVGVQVAEIDFLGTPWTRNESP